MNPTTTQQIIKFKPNLSNEQSTFLQQMLKKFSLEQFSQMLSHTSSLEFYGLNYDDFISSLKSIEEWRISQFVSRRFNKSNHASLLKYISHVKLQNIQRIIIKNQVINNIEPVQFLDCPKLQLLQFNTHECFSTKPLIKTNFSKLQALYIYQNMISQNSDIYHLRRFNRLNDMSCMQIGFKKINYYSLRYDFVGDNYDESINIDIMLAKWLSYSC